jgi:microcystin-dependent protein
MDGTLGFTLLFAGNFAPLNWALCDGSKLLIAFHPLLFKLIGNRYGGDGIKTFCLPDLRGRVIVGAAQGTSAYYNPGNSGGNTTVVLNTKTLPAHTHTVTVTITPAAAGVTNSSSPVSDELFPDKKKVYATNADKRFFRSEPNTRLAEYTAAIATTASGNEKPEPVPIQHPVLVLNYIICIHGPFPDRDK